MTLPRHEGNHEVAAECKLPTVGRGTVSEWLASLDLCAFHHHGLVVDAGSLVRPFELHERHRVLAIVRGSLDDDLVTRDEDDLAINRRENDFAGICRCSGLHAGTDKRRIRRDKWHSLALHIRTHESAVRIVVLEERDQRSRHRDNLLRRNVHVVDLVGCNGIDLATGLPHQDPVVRERSIVVKGSVRLSDHVALFKRSRQVVDPLRDLATDDTPVWRFDESIGVHPSVRRKRSDETNVRTLRGLDRAHATVMRRVNIADFESGTLAAQATWAEG